MQIHLGIFSHRFESLAGLFGQTDCATANVTVQKLHNNVPSPATVDIVIIDIDNTAVNYESLFPRLASYPIVIVTDNQQDFDAEYWLNTGATDYLFDIHSEDPARLKAQLRKSLLQFTSGNRRRQQEPASVTHNRIMQGSPVMAAVWTMPGPNCIEFLHVTQNIDQLGIKGADLLDGTVNWVDLMDPEDGRQSYRQLCQLIESGVEKYMLTYRIRTQNSGVRWVQDYGRIFRHTDGSVKYFESLIIDITEQKTADQKYRELFLQAEQQTKELRLLDKVQTAIANKASLQSLYETTVETVSSILGYELVTITLVRDGRLWRGPYKGYMDDSMPQSMEMNTGLVGKAALSGKPILVEDVTTDPLYCEFIPDVVSNIGVPFFCCEGEAYGVLLVERKQTPLTKRDLRLLSKVAEQLSLAVENVLLQQRTQANLNRAQALYKISESIQDAHDTETMLDEIVKSTRKAVSAKWAIIYKFDYENRSIGHISKTGRDNTLLQSLNFEQLQTGLTGWAIEHQQVVLATDVKTDSRENKYVKDYKNGAGQLGSAIVAPLLIRNKPIGTLAVVNSADDPVFSEKDRELIGTVANQSASAITKHQLLKQIRHQAFHDSLTGLPNRSKLDEIIRQAIKTTKDCARTAVLFIDLDGFKHINDTLGHHVGDDILVKVSARLQAVLPRHNTLVRLGGDEFAAIITDVSDHKDAIATGNQLLAALKPSFTVEHHNLQVGASIGLSLYPDDTTEPASLLRYADTAMYHAKAEGKNVVRCFIPALEQRANERLALESYLCHAIEKDELFLEYQPQFCLSSHKLIGFEALLRWQHPERGRMAPDQFIPIAEESGLIVKIGQWVLEEVCRQSMQWQADGYPALRTALNISSIQFERDDFVDQVQQVLDKSGIATHLLEFEVTESVVMRNVSVVIERLRKLREMGLHIAIDDFGTGYSSLQYLQQLPLDALKIDRSFITRAGERHEDKALIETIIALAKRFELRTVAEGVENQQQLHYLSRAGCTEAQGYYFAKPLPAEDIEKQYFKKTEKSHRCAA